MEATQFSKMEYSEIALHFIFAILNMLHTLPSIVAAGKLKNKQVVGALICQTLLKTKVNFKG